jgi:LmbE family N-acetylglucosaminyl deacetylase/uncharacterized protein (DUF2141 family)
LLVFQSRALPTLTVAAVVLAAALLLASLPAKAQANPFCTQTKMNIVAHQDDDLIFQNPALLEAIAAGDCVRTVFVTAGDAGLGEAYWREREEGSRAAYAVMAGVANSWTKSESTVAGHTLHVATLNGKPTVSQVYLRLPNGGASGTGYAATGFKSLPKLWRSSNPEPASLTPISELSALDGSATYTYGGLLATLEALIAEFEPEVISTQDFTTEFGAGDHADHITVAKLTRIAANAWTTEHVLRSYMDYESKNFAVNVFEPQLSKKLSAYYAYAAHDSNEACATQHQCEEPFYADYWAWLKRQIVVAETSVPGADAGPDQAVASKAAVTLDGSGSSDPLGHTLSYEWKQTAGPTVTLSNSKAVKPTFTAPTGPASLVFSLLVKSSEASSKTDSVTVNVAAPKYALKVTRSGNGSGTVISSPAGIECGSDCEESYEQGTKVVLTPSPAAGSEFKSWSGACTGTGACEVTMSTAKTVGAEFALQRHLLTVSKSGTGSGTVTSSPAGISCGATCEASFDHGTEVTLSATPAAGSEFKGWSGACTGTGTCKVTMSSAKAVGAEFALVPKYALKVTRSGNGSGTVTSSPAGIECGADCEESYEQGTKVVLSPSPAAGSEFKGWSGACSGSGTCEVTMSAAKTVGAEFALQRHSLSVTKSGTGSGTVTSSPAGINCGATCEASFDHGTEVTLSASPASGSEFKGWSGACTGTGACKVTMSSAKAVGAEFSPVPKYALKVTRSGNGSGSVTSSPAGIEGGSDCEGSYEQGTEVTLTASPAAGSEFKGWSGACTGTGTCKVTMSAAKSVGAEFALQRHSLSVTKSGSGSGTVTSSPAGIECGATCEASFDHGTLVKLVGTPAAGSKAVTWSGCDKVNGANECEVTMSAAKAITATFNLESHQLTVVKNGSGTGTVTSSPAGINCGSECSASFLHGTLVKLTGTPTTGSKAVTWSGCDKVNGANECEVTMSAARKVEATFTLESHLLSVTKSGTGSGTVTSSPAGINCGATCEASFDHGTEVTLSASPAAGSEFKGWSGACTGTGTCKVAMSAAKAVGAEFALVPKYALKVTRSGNGSGTVTSAPTGIECGADCEESYEQGTKVTLTPSPTAGSEFKGWSGACTGTGTCEVTMSAAKSVGAEFALQPHSLTVTKSGSGSGTVTSAPAGINCGATCEVSFDHGTLVKLTGTPAAGSKAVTWSGCDKVTGANECEVTVSAAKAITATFNLESHQLTVVKNGSGAGTVTSSPASINCGSECSASFLHGTLVKLSGAPGANTKAVVWESCPGTVNASNQCELTVNAAKEVEVRFDLESHVLTVEEDGSGSGTVTSSPAGIDCSAECQASFAHGTLVTLTGSPGPNTKAVAWESCPGTVNASNQCELTVDAAKKAKARFDLESHQLTVDKVGSGTVTSSPAGIACGATCEAAFDHGTEVTLTAAPAAEFKAAVWSGCDAIVGSDECEVMMAAAKEVTAKFDPVGTYALKVKQTGNGAGVVTSSPAGIACGTTCEAAFDEGTKVKLASISATGSKAVEWSGCDAVLAGECEVTMSASKEVTATYTLETRSLKISKTGDGAGTVISSPTGINCGATCETAFDYGAPVTLSVASADTETVAWAGCDEVSGDECRVSMDADREVSAELDRVIPTPEQTPTPNPTPTPTSPPTPSTAPSIKLLKAKVEHKSGTARFVFAARGSATGFRCALASVRQKQKLKYKLCTSPMTYRNLVPGTYVFKVKAVGPAGTDTPPATRKFKVRKRR